jgi:TRAP-type C4-dicarboxylate transport system substrate-binding protein
MEKKRSNAFAVVETSLLIGFIIFIVALTGAVAAETRAIDLDKNYSWKMTSAMNAGQDGNKGIVEFVKLLDQRTKGKVKINLYEGTLGAPTDAWDMVKNNAVQFTFTSDLYNAARMPILGMVGLPMELPSQKAVLITANEWLKAGQLKELTDNFKVLFFLSTHPLTVFLRNKKVVTMDDFKGLKIRCGGPAQSQGVALLGATGVSMPGGEQYMALQTGVLDGAISGIDMALDRKFYEVARHAPRMPLYYGIYLLLMNKETWNGLPPELQKLIEQTANEISASEVERRQRAEDALWSDKYVKDAEAKGHPAKEALELMRKVTAKER